MKLLDTDICIHFLARGTPEVVSRFADTPPEALRLASVVKAELLYGARKSSSVAANLRRLERFFAAYESLPFDDRAAEPYAGLRADLERTGQPIGANDLLIASIALAHGATLVTRNDRDFARVPGLVLERW